MVPEPSSNLHQPMRSALDILSSAKPKDKIKEIEKINFLHIMTPPVFRKHKELYLPKKLEATDARISRHKL
jgi:hypothetical protein